jgi:hypothetical protein
MLAADPGGRSLVGIVDSNPVGDMDSCLLRLFCVVMVSATGRSLIQRCHTECGVSKCYIETSTLKRPRPTRAVEQLKC